MTLKDFFHLSEEEFAARISTLPDEQLLKDDIHNLRTTHSGAIGATLGALEVPATAGVSLIGSAIGLRRRNVAKRRLEIIHAEMEKRGLDVHKGTKRDFLIPLAISGATMGLGGPVVEGLMGAIPVQSLVDAGFDATTTATSMVVSEAAGKVGVEVGGEKVFEKGVEGSGRGRIWGKGLGVSRSVEGLGATGREVEGRVELPITALSAPGSPGLESEWEVPPLLPPRPVVGAGVSAGAVETLPEIVVTAPQTGSFEEAGPSSWKILRKPVGS